MEEGSRSHYLKKGQRFTNLGLIFLRDRKVLWFCLWLLKTYCLFCFKSRFTQNLKMYTILSQNSSEMEEGGPGQTTWHYTMCSRFQHADQGRHGPKSLRTEGWSQPVTLIKDKDLPPRQIHSPCVNYLQVYVTDFNLFLNKVCGFHVQKTADSQ